MTEAGTSLRTCSLEQLISQSRPPAGRHLKISRIRDCAGSHRPADIILICVDRAKTCDSYHACERCGAVQWSDDFYVAGNIQRYRQLWGLANRSIWRKIGITRASAVRVISISLAQTLPVFYFVRNACRLETENVEYSLYTIFHE